MRLLWIATKAPHPPLDGGRLLLAGTLAALRAAGVEITLVAPVDPAAFDLAAVATALADRCRSVLVPLPPRPRLRAALGALLGDTPAAVVRHTRQEVVRAVEAELARGPFDAVVVEQPHALPQAEPARRRGLPVVLRAQNVESDLWQLLAKRRRGLAAALLRREATRLSRFEAAAVRRVSLTVALSERDAARLRSLTGGAARVVAVPAPFPAVLPPGPRTLAGHPALVLFGSEGWPPNQDATKWFLSDGWPAVRSATPAARLHVFGGRATGRRGEEPAPSSGAPTTEPAITWLPAPADSAEAYAPGSVLVLPLRVASGIRIRILEAWARGVAVIATPEAAAGLVARNGEELLLASETGDYALCAARLAGDPELTARLIAGGRRRLVADHAPERVAARWLELLDELVAARSAAR